MDSQSRERESDWSRRHRSCRAEFATLTGSILEVQESLIILVWLFLLDGVSGAPQLWPLLGIAMWAGKQVQWRDLARGNWTARA